MPQKFLEQLPRARPAGRDSIADRVAPSRLPLTAQIVDAHINERIRTLQRTRGVPALRVFPRVITGPGDSPANPRQKAPRGTVVAPSIAEPMLPDTGVSGTVRQTTTQRQDGHRLEHHRRQHDLATQLVRRGPIGTTLEAVAPPDG